MAHELISALWDDAEMWNDGVESMLSNAERFLVGILAEAASVDALWAALRLQTPRAFVEGAIVRQVAATVEGLKGSRA